MKIETSFLRGDSDYI